MTTTRTATWNPPGPGGWICDRSHCTPGCTPLYTRIVSEHTAPTYRAVMAAYGGALDTIDMQIVNGAMYRRLVPLVRPDADNGKVPPRPVLWLASRLHPAFRQREKAARRALADKPFLHEIRAWYETDRARWRQANLDLQAVDPGQLDDPALARHLDALDRHLVAGWRHHHRLHGADLGPIGDLLAHTNRWGIDPVEVMGLLRGSSPATVDAARHGRVIADALARAGVDPAMVSSLDQVRSVPGAAEALDAYLEDYGWRLVTAYDITGRTLSELPAVVCTLIRQAASGSDPSPEETDAASGGVATRLRAQADDPILFDDLLAAARQAYGLRDDNGPLTWEWPAGLMRRGYLEAGRRLAAAGRLEHPDHAFELDAPELAALLDGAPGPGPAEVAARAATRVWQAALEAPDTLGPVGPDPDLSVLPRGMRRTMGMVVAAVTMLDADKGRKVVPLTGLGIGSAPYQGRARVADDPTGALLEMEPGDVLVAPWTAPSYNSVLAIAGGVVVQEGGLLCHAAVMARELGIPAVIGCSQAMSSIRSGDLIEVDPVAGAVTVLEAAPA